jgi:hypothetical protein
MARFDYGPCLPTLMNRGQMHPEPLSENRSYPAMERISGGARIPGREIARTRGGRVRFFLRRGRIERTAENLAAERES